MDNQYCDQKIIEFKKEIETISKIIPTIMDRLEKEPDSDNVVAKIKEAVINVNNGVLYACPNIETIKTYQRLFEVKFVTEEEIIELEKLHRLYWNVNDFTYRLRNSEWKHFDGDIIITDPCYLVHDILSNDYDYELERMYSMLEKNGMYRDTIYGDWSCTTYNTDTKSSIGTFCADGGEVCVALLSEILRLNPCYDDHVKKDWTATWIKDFHGDVRFIVNEEHYEYEGKDCIDYAVQVEGKGNINFITSQTGL